MTTVEKLQVKSAELLSGNKKEIEFVQEVIPVIGEVGKEQATVEADYKSRIQTFADMLKEAKAEADAELKADLDALKKMDTDLRAATKSRYTGTDSIKVDTSTLVILQPWTYTVDDLSKVPRDYLTIDTAKVMADIKKGLRKIKGLNIHQGRTIQIRTGKTEDVPE